MRAAWQPRWRARWASVQRWPRLQQACRRFLFSILIHTSALLPLHPAALTATAECMLPTRLLSPGITNWTALKCCQELKVCSRQPSLQGLPAGSTTRQFASDLLTRLPRGGGSAAAAAAAAQRQREAEAAAFARKQQQYSLIVDEEEDAAEQERRRLQQQEAQRQREQQQDGGGKADKRRLRRSKQELDGEDETVVKRKSRKRAWEEDDEGAAWARVTCGSSLSLSRHTGMYAGYAAAECELCVCSVSNKIQRYCF